MSGANSSHQMGTVVFAHFLGPELTIVMPSLGGCPCLSKFKFMLTFIEPITIYLVKSNTLGLAHWISSPCSVWRPQLIHALFVREARSRTQQCNPNFELFTVLHSLEYTLLTQSFSQHCPMP